MEPSLRSGICRSSNGVALACWIILSVSRTPAVILSTLLRNRMRGMPRSSSLRMMSCRAGIFFASASATTTTTSQAASTGSASKANSTEPGQSMKVRLSPMNSVVATQASTLMAWARASAE
jgi:hypothetical protein